MNKKQLHAIIVLIDYKPDTCFRIIEKNDLLFIQHMQNIADCNEAKSTCWQKGRKFYISEHMTESEVIQTCLLAVLLFEEHEAREWLTYKGKAIHGPHIDVSQKDARQTVAVKTFAPLYSGSQA